MGFVFDAEEYTELNRNRISIILNRFGTNWFSGKKVLGLGCGHANMENILYTLGAIVTVTDARKEHLDIVNNKYPQLKTILYDLNNKDWPFENDYDFILNTGIVYHLKEFESFLNNCFSNCKNMFLESIVTDSDNPNLVVFVQEKGLDQSFTDEGCRPSFSNLERIIKNNGFTFERHLKRELNTTQNLFDWESKNTGESSCIIDNKFFWLRRAWFCSK